MLASLQGGVDGLMGSMDGWRGHMSKILLFTSCSLVPSYLPINADDAESCRVLLLLTVYAERWSPVPYSEFAES